MQVKTVLANAVVNGLPDCSSGLSESSGLRAGAWEKMAVLVGGWVLCKVPGV